MIDFSALYRAHAGEVNRFVLFLSGDPALAEDLVAETFVRLWSARERVDLATVKGYLFTIARNLFLQHRQRSRFAVSLDRWRDDPRDPSPADRLADPRPGPEARAATRSDLRATLAALQELPEIDRAALLMRADDGLPYQEIGAALGLSLVAVRVKVHRARLKLAAALAGTVPAEAGSSPDDPPRKELEP